MNGSQQVYAWVRNNYLKEIDFWVYDLLQITDGSCIEIDSLSMFRDWALGNCSNYNYFICSRPVPEGINFQSQSIACIDNQFEFLCPNGGSIHVDFAAFGNNQEHNEICLSSASAKVNFTYWEECIHPSSLQTMISMCQGLSYCRIKNLQSLFPDNPCLPTTPISLQYRMRCLFEPMTTCPPRAIYQSGRCYVPYVREKPLSYYEAQTKCRKQVSKCCDSVSFSINNRNFEIDFEI
uniref:SUEL-type lectin domain-containing protein n=1 Tax=Elaeophora elaphi TaxID=1147741 RepID=A0A0R3RL83_9BILA